MKFIKFYKSVFTRVDYQLKLFEAVHAEYFHQTIVENTWTPDAIFRHILWAMNGLTTMNSSEKFELDIEPMKTGGVIGEDYALSDVRKNLNGLNDHLINIFEKLSIQDLDEEKTTFLGSKTTLEGQLTSALLHVTEHLGELRWQFKRLTGWTDKEVYSLKS